MTLENEYQEHRSNFQVDAVLSGFLIVGSLILWALDLPAHSVMASVTAVVGAGHAVRNHYLARQIKSKLDAK